MKNIQVHPIEYDKYGFFCLGEDKYIEVDQIEKVDESSNLLVGCEGLQKAELDYLEDVLGKSNLSNTVTNIVLKDGTTIKVAEKVNYIQELLEK